MSRLMRNAYRVATTGDEPLTLAQAKEWLRVDSDQENDALEVLITTAREIVEFRTGRAIPQQTWKLVASDWPRSDIYGNDTLALPTAPLLSVENVKYYPDGGGAQQTMSSALYHTAMTGMPGMIVLVDGQSFPDLTTRPDAVEINYTAGYASTGAVPKPLLHAIKLVLSHLYENRTPVVVGTIASPLPLGLENLLDGYRVEGWIA